MKLRMLTHYCGDLPDEQIKHSNALLLQRQQVIKI